MTDPEKKYNLKKKIVNVDCFLWRSFVDTRLFFFLEILIFFITD